MERTTLSATSSIVSLLEPLWCLAGHHDWRAPPVSPPLVIGINLGQRSKTDIDTAIAFFRLKIPAGKSRGKDTKRRLFAGCRLL